MKPSPKAHLKNARAIIGAIAKRPCHPSEPRYGADSESLRRPRLLDYQRHLAEKFATTLNKPSFDYISKTADSWLIVGDRREEIAADVLLIIERHGLGVGLLALHLQQLRAGHILSRIKLSGRTHNLASPTGCLRGARGERVLFIPIRQFRADFVHLAQNDIAKPKALWDLAAIVTHERDRNPCHYCSCREINPAEVVVDMDRSRHGLSRHYSIGFTYAPFGNPLSVIHFLAWDRASKPLNMNRVPMTVSDLVKLTREINVSIRDYFAGTGIHDYPVLDGLSNGWAGNSIFHQHFQFFAPEHPAPIIRAPAVGRDGLICRDDARVDRLRWGTPVYRIRAADALNTGLIGNDLAGIWRLLGGSRKVPYKPFHDGYTPTEGEKVHAHTQNLYVPGRDLGTSAYIILRDRERVNFRPAADDWVNPARKLKALRKDNIGVLEATGTLIVDDRQSFREMKRWRPSDLSRQAAKMLAVIAPDAAKVREFETAVRELFPQ
jgi:hypothetical protein